MGTPLLTLCDVRKSFTETNDRQLHVLKNINFGLNQGESIAIVGASGCGKSTLLNIICTLDDPSSGTVLFQGQNLADWNATRKAQYRNREVGIIFQDHHLLPQFTVIENVLVPSLKWDHHVVKRAKMLLEKVGLIDRENSFPGVLSGGERQRVAVIRALINQPKLVLADEPTGSLDQDNSTEVIDLLLALTRDEQVALVTVTHNQDVALRMARIYQLSEGQLEEVE